MTGRYAIEWEPPARRAISRLPEKVATAVVEFLYTSVAANPRRVSKPLRFDLSGLRTARRGDYRVLYRIDDEAGVVEVIAIEHRADLYRERNW